MVTTVSIDATRSAASVMRVRTVSPARLQRPPRERPTLDMSRSWRKDRGNERFDHL